MEFCETLGRRLRAAGHQSRSRERRQVQSRIRKMMSKTLCLQVRFPVSKAIHIDQRGDVTG